MKFIQIFGPQAVGKMTVGQELAKTTGLKLFHNHMAIDFVSQFFGYDTDEGQRLVNLIRMEIFSAVAKSDLYGLIFTIVRNLDNPTSWDYTSKICDIFESNGAEIYFVELEADFETRIERNQTPNRLLYKPSKRDVEHSDESFRRYESKGRFNSLPGEIKNKNYVRINNTNLSPEETAKAVKNIFAL